MPEYDDPYDQSRRSARRAIAAARMHEQQSWFDLQAKRAVERGKVGDPPRDGAELDPDWWAERLAAREGDAVLPPRLALLREDANLDDRLDDLDVERDVRREVEDFNERVIRARDQLPGDPAPITLPRDVDATVEAWGERRAAVHAPRTRPAARPARRPWWNRRTRREGDT